MAHKRAVQIDIVPNMYELGIFKQTLLSRKRLRVTALIAVIALTGAFLGAGLFIRYGSTSGILDGFLIVSLYLAAIVVGYLVALVIGDVFFAGPWREKMARGDKFIPEDLEDQKALLKNKNIYFIFIWLGSIVGLIFGCDFATGANILWYQSVGGSIVSMRSADPTERASVLKTLSNPFHSNRWSDEEVRSAARALVLDPDPEVRARAAYFAGRAKIAESTEDLMTALRDENNTPHARAEAAIALGRMEWQPARALLLSVMRNTFENSHQDTELVPAVLYAFYSLKDSLIQQQALSMLEICLSARDCSSEILQYTFFYLKTLQIKEASKMAFRYLEAESITDEMRCLATDSLRFTASKSDVPALKREFEKAPMDFECPVIYRKYHEEAAIMMFERDPLRSLLLRAIGNQSKDDGADFDWIWMVGSNPKENAATRKVAEMYTRAMKDKGLVK